MEKNFKRKDISNKFLDNIFIDRYAELDLLNKEYEKLLEGDLGFVTVVGLPGVGKTCLIENALKKNNNSNYAYGKYNNNERITLVGITEVLNQIVNHIATLPKKTFIQIKDELTKSLNGDLVLLATISGKLKDTFGINESANIENFNKLKYRIKKAVFIFIQLSSRYLFPLIVCLDDLQWADQLSVDIIHSLISKKDHLNVCLILSFRDNELRDYTENLYKIAKKHSIYIQVEKLDLNNIEQYVYEVFGEKINNKDYLVRFLFGLTMGTPFYIKEFIKILVQSDIISYVESDSCWEFNLDKINEFLISNDIEIILKNKINEDNKDTYNLMELIACLDGRADFEVLKSAHNIKEEQLNEYINNLVDEAIIFKDYSEDKSLRILFTHDIIYKMVESTISLERKEKIHYNIAETVYDIDGSSYIEKNSFIASHLIRCAENSVRRDADKWINLLYETGLTEKHRASIDLALNIFQLASKILPACTSTNDLFYVKLQLELAECLFLYKRHDECEEIIEYLIKNYNNDTEMLAIKWKQIYIYQYKREHKKVLELGTQILNYLQFGFGKYRLPIDIIQGLFYYRPSKISKIIDAPKVDDDKYMLVLQVLTLMNVSAALTDDDLTGAIGLSAAIVAVKYGKSADSLIGYASYCYVQFIILKDYKNAKKLFKIVDELGKKAEYLETKPVVYFLLGGYLSHWWKPLKQVDSYLLESIYYGEKTGDFTFVGYSIATSISTKFAMGTSIYEIENFIKRCMSNYPEMDQYVTKFIYELTLKHINDLREGFSGFESSEVSDKYELLTPLEIVSEEEIMFQKMLAMNKVKEGYELAKKVTPKIKLSYGLLSSLELIFNSVLFRILYHDRLNGKEKNNNLRTIKKQIKMLQYWVDIYQYNYYAKLLLVIAEFNIHIKSQKDGMQMLNEAIVYANKQGNTYLEAIINILAARQCSNNDKLMKFYAKEGAQLLKTWGADFFSIQIEKEFDLYKNDLEDNINYIGDKISNENEKSISEFYTLVSNMNEEEAIKYIFKAIIKKDMAKYCAVIYEENGEMFLKYEMHKSKKLRVFSSKVNINYIQHIAHKVIRYAGRTGNDAIYSSKLGDSHFVNDPHIQAMDGLNIACIPIIHYDIIIGVFYIEKLDEEFSAENIQYIKSFLPAIITKQRIVRNNKAIESILKSKSLLTKREMEILKLAANGKANQDISDELGISLNTTKKHISSILSKLEADSRIQAILKAKEKGLL